MDCLDKHQQLRRAPLIVAVSWLIQVDYRFTHWRSHG
jgi:hypothetical protein